jgi:hypothetical protein
MRPGLSGNSAELRQLSWVLDGLVADEVLMDLGWHKAQTWGGPHDSFFDTG